ncbi:MAG: COX15/CtaA family protein [Isosphaeraceae bacterium]|nr:COX15/CtaA family protein [Isosphaeraceae bacterium]
MNASNLSQPDAYRPGRHRVALAATSFTWPLLFVGGLVTTYRVGMAVPDWPTTFGINMFLYDMSQAAWGVFVEHGHRLYGAAVGLCVIWLTVDFLVFGKNRTHKILAVIALIAVIAQGLLGGVRVLRNSTLLASVHGATGQLFFGYMVVLCLLTSRAATRAPIVIDDPRRLQSSALRTVVLAYGQILLGAWLRHFPNPAALAIHSAFSLGVVVHVLLTARAVGRLGESGAPLRIPSAVMIATLTVQVILGAASWLLLRPFDGIPRDVTSLQALIRTGHQANAALLLGSTAWVAGLALLRYRTSEEPRGVIAASHSASRIAEEVLA